MLTRRSLIVVSAMCASPMPPHVAVAAPRAGGGTDAYRSFPFLLEFGGVARAGFRQSLGLDEGIISLKRGTTDDAELRQWLKDTAGGKAVRKSGSIILRDADRAEAIRWNFRQGWPTKWIGQSLDATGNEMVIETLEIGHEGLKRV